MVSAGEAAGVAPAPVQTPAPVPAQVQAQSPEDPLIVSVAESSTGFAADLYAQLRSQPGNLSFSPLSLSQALLPIVAGVQGPAASELGKVLHLNVPLPEAADGLSTLTRRLQRSAGGENNLAFARALWVQQWNSINNDYIDLLRQHCRSELRVIDFARPEHAVHWINRWVSDRTDDTITAIADEKSYEPNACLVVGNAIYFRTGWQRSFDPTLTELAPFFVPELPAQTASAPVASGVSAAAAATPTPVSGAPIPAAPAGAPAKPAASTPPATSASVAAARAPAQPAAVPVAVPTMRRIAPFRLAVQPGFKLLQLPYRGEQLSLVILLPDTEVSLAQVEPQLTAPRIAECLRTVRDSAPARIELRLPRFKAERAVPQLAATLKKMGMNAVFDTAGSADFSVFGSNIDGAPIYLSAVSHVVRLVVDEQGALGQAGTAPQTDGAYDAPVEVPAAFTVNRPFLFFICDQQTGALLFMGRIVDPRAS